jgi:hypothetical protein
VSAQDLLWRSGPEEGVPSKTAGAHSCLQTGGNYELGGEAPGRSSGRIILNGPLTLPRSWLKGGSIFWWGVSSKWLKVDFFSLGLGREVLVSHLQGEGGPVLTWLPIVNPNSRNPLIP